MKHTIELNDQQLEILKTIFSQIAPTVSIVVPTSKPKKLSKIDQCRQDMAAYRANKAARKKR